MRNAARMVFLLNRRFAPYYKWVFRAMRDLPKLGGLSEKLTDLLISRESGEATLERIEAVCAEIATELRAQGLSDREDVYLEPHAFAVQSGIVDREICALHIMEG